MNARAFPSSLSLSVGRGVLCALLCLVAVPLRATTPPGADDEPVVTNHASHVLFQIAAESATRAVRRCQPFRLPASKYEAWRDVEVKFDPNDMFRG